MESEVGGLQKVVDESLFINRHCVLFVRDDGSCLQSRCRKFRFIDNEFSRLSHVGWVDDDSGGTFEGGCLKMIKILAILIVGCVYVRIAVMAYNQYKDEKEWRKERARIIKEWRLKDG